MFGGRGTCFDCEGSARKLGGRGWVFADRDGVLDNSTSFTVEACGTDSAAVLLRRQARGAVDGEGTRSLSKPSCSCRSKIYRSSQVGTLMDCAAPFGANVIYSIVLGRLSIQD